VTVELSNLPYVAAMIALILILIALQRRQPRIAIGSWLIGLSLIFIAQMSGYFLGTGQGYMEAHIFRLCCDLTAGMVFMLYTGRPIPKSFHRTFLPLCNAIPFLALEVIYGLDIQHPAPYLVCAVAAILLCFVIAFRLRLHWSTPASQSTAWLAIATVAALGNYRAAAYWGLGTVYFAAALHLRARLRQSTLGRLIVVTSLMLWAASFFIHAWIFHNPIYGPMAEVTWTMQKFFVTLGLLIVLLEDKARENEYLAHRDDLTGLANRRLMDQRLQAAIATGQANVILLDLNGFKAVNDSFGHHAGDQLLQIVAKRLTHLITLEDTLARPGGDEFVIITPHPPEQLVASIRNTISQPANINETSTVQINASVGAASFPSDLPTEPPDQIATHLLRLADHRMYLDKHPLS